MVSAAQLLLRPPPLHEYAACTHDPSIDSSSCSGTYRDSVSHSIQIASQTLTYTSTEHPGATLLCAISRCNWRGQPPTATLKIIETCLTTYKTHRLPRGAASFKSLYLQRPHSTSTKAFSPRALHQRCWVHKMRNILDKVRRRDHDAVKADAQAIYRADSRRQAEAAFRSFRRRWQSVYGWS